MDTQYNDQQKRVIEIARKCFLRDDNLYGCAESTYISLKTIFDLQNPQVSSPAIAFNGGIAYSGAICGAITGAALAVGELAEYRIKDHQAAKKSAREIVHQLIIDFRNEFSSNECVKLIPYQLSIPLEHNRFIMSGIWRVVCMKQIEFTVAKTVELVDRHSWIEPISSKH
jgi:C_GCAxxG_C_C family probable redox protein